jgi:Zn-dependent peptidase ImmA (M78 family)
MSAIEEAARGADAARRARSRLGLGLDGPLADILIAIEDVARVPVTILALPGGLAGLQGRRGERSYIFVNGNESVVRQRFTLAHEFGHVELGHAGSVDYTSDVDGSGRKPPAETQADGFAAEFLAPEAGVRQWLAAVGDPPSDLETVVRLADYFHVSAEVALYRLQAARYLRKRDYEPILARIQGHEHKALAQRLGLCDEFDDVLTKAVGALPRLPRETLNQAATAFERGLLTVEQVAQLLEVEPAAIQREFDRRGIIQGHSEPDY